MNPTSMVLRWYRQSISQAHSQPQYTPEEVLQLLRPTDALDDERAEQTYNNRIARSEAVRQVAARPATWLGKLTKQQRQEIGGLADRLPSLIFHHAIGANTAELVRRFGGWSTWRYDHALKIAGTCIASHLNSTQSL
jgi:hypothetical protein